MFTTWNKSSAELPASFIETTLNKHQDVPPTWSRVLDGSLYSIDCSQTDSLCCSAFRMVWSMSLQTTSNQTTPVREVPNVCVNYRQPKTYTSTPFTLRPVLQLGFENRGAQGRAHDVRHLFFLLYGITLYQIFCLYIYIYIYIYIHTQIFIYNIYNIDGVLSLFAGTA